MKLTLKQWRAVKEKTQKEVADAIGVSEAAICKWERGETSPRLKHIQAIASLYEISIDDIVMPESST